MPKLICINTIFLLFGGVQKVVLDMSLSRRPSEGKRSLCSPFRKTKAKISPIVSAEELRVRAQEIARNFKGNY